ncbi:TPA: hypothetical protein ACQ72S_004717 [Escherichia coli]|uniref:hypothetical protein n=1 Tax=Escherichia coli TaxID=562 RepID=UPI0010CB03DE|nr:hypothetical protein [Escherichia coli]EFF9393600.1 hypothetical protein [Escherichia coli]EHB8449911.1 hypothetical protein [Escherichia coli]EHB8459347.1 hypothetical protein [Escherichia coli]EHH6693416.1 hypothetical protein [Escherichia coli]EKQ9614811.1 hypothetical protein [Escherichia coli]
MSTFTKEQLIEKLQHRISVASRFPESEKAQMDLELARIALASLEAEPYGYVHKAAYEQAGSCGLSGDHEAYRDSSTHIAVYTATPAPVSVPAAMEIDDDFDSAFEHGKAVGWNAYRAAMLQAEPVSNSDELPLDYLQGHKDGLEWAAQLAEANHPQTGDWLYDDPIDLARAIRKGPDMPTVQGGNSPVIPDGWVMVPVEPTIAILDEFDSIIDYGAEDSKDAWSRLLAAAWIKSLPAAPRQEVNRG